MNGAIFEKDNVLTALTEINHQLEELESLLEESFSDLRGQWYCEEKQRLAACEQKISSLENLTETIIQNKGIIWDYNHFSMRNKNLSSLKMELGFQ